MIKTLSPYYLNIPFVSPFSATVCEFFTLYIWVWSGDKTAVPTNPEYAEIKYNSTGSTGINKIDIARLINDFIDFEAQAPVAGLQDANNQVWARWLVIYDVDPTEEQLIETQLCVKGWSHFLQGENAQNPANRILLTGDEIRAHRNSMFNFPIQILEP